MNEVRYVDLMKVLGGTSKLKLRPIRDDDTENIVHWKTMKLFSHSSFLGILLLMKCTIIGSQRKFIEVS